MRKIQFNELPKILQHISDPPKHLYIRGTLPNHNEYKFLCVVGSRKYSDYGKEACEFLLSGLVGYPIVIVSGLALGIDSIAHKVALANNLITIALPGSGLNDSVIHPSIHLSLAEKILESKGALISELEPETRGAPWTFPRRNRIMAGISDAVLVIEAESESGTKITARLATEYGRDVFVVPGSIFSSTSIGTNEIIREGGTPVTCPEELLEGLGFYVGEQRQVDLNLLTTEEREIFHLCAQPISRGELMRKLNWGLNRVSSVIMEMELKGYVIESDGYIRRR